MSEGRERRAGPEDIGMLLAAAAQGNADDPALALAIEQATAGLSPDELAVVADVLEQATSIIQRRTAQLERTESSMRSGQDGDDADR
jgi:hypothetical protein